WFNIQTKLHGIQLSAPYYNGMEGMKAGHGLDPTGFSPAARPRRAHYLICLGMGATVGFVAAFGESFYAPLAFPVLIFSQALFSMRGLLTAPLHGITATLTGFGIGLWQKSGNARLLLIPLVAAMVIHGSFNLLASII